MATPHRISAAGAPSYPLRCARCARSTRAPYWKHIGTRRQRPYCEACSRRAADRQWVRYLQLQLPIGGAQ